MYIYNQIHCIRNKDTAKLLFYYILLYAFGVFGV